MQRTQEVSDHIFNQVKEMMLQDGFENPTFDTIFDMALEVKERMEDCHMNVSQAYFDIMY